MNKWLIIVPGTLALVFLGFERPAHEKLLASAQARTDQLARDRAAEDARRVAAQQLAATESAKRTAEREAQDRLKAEAKQRAYEVTLHHTGEQAAAHLATCEQLSTELATLDRQLADTRARQNAVDQETFDLTKRVEAQLVARHTLDFQIQRTTAMLTRRFAESPWAAQVASSPTPASKK